MTRDQLEQARAALEMAREEPGAALVAAQALIDEESDREVAATAHFACGLAHRTLANGSESTDHLERATDLASESPILLGQILRSLAFNYAQAGQHELSNATIDKSIAILDGQEADLSRLQQAFLSIMRGEHHRALPALTAAVSGFAEQGADDYLELTLYNRALVFVAFGDYDAAIGDLERAYEIAMRLEHHVSAADAALHLSQVLGWRDDVPEAMRWHARSVELRTAAGAINPVADAEHAFVLIQARLMSEAEETLRGAIPRLVEAGDNEAILVASRLLLVEVLVDKGAYPDALHQVELARADTPADGRWRFDIAAADHRVRAASGETSVGLLQSMLRTADEMTANGEVHAAAVERLRGVEVALAQGRTATAADLVQEARRYTRSGPLWLQIQAWTAIAQMRLAAGDRRGAAAAVRAGMSRLDAYRGGIGATDLRMRATAYGTELARIGVGLAVTSGSASRAFTWSERLRARTGTAARERDPELETALADLRRAMAEARHVDPVDAATAQQRVAAEEARVRQLGRERAGEAVAVPRAGIDEVRDLLEEQNLVSFVEDGPLLYAIVVSADTTRLIALGDIGDVIGIVDHLRFAAERVARPSTSAQSRLAAIDSASESTRALHERLIAPLGIEPERLVVIPSGALHGVPWGMVLDIPVVVAPSAISWMKATRRAVAGTSRLVVSGPDLVHAGAEADEIAAMIEATRTTTVDATISHLAGSSLVHFACHARSRTDSPLFSSLVLDDGELTLYDIERLPAVPATIVLAACSGAGSVLATGAEVLSIAGSFLSMGARSVVAPLFTVSDEVTHTVMSSMHRSMGNGLDPAHALVAAAQCNDPTTRFTARSFVCVGAT